MATEAIFSEKEGRQWFANPLPHNPRLMFLRAFHKLEKFFQLYLI